MITEDLFDGIQPLINGRVTAAYLEFLSMRHIVTTDLIAFHLLRHR